MPPSSGSAITGRSTKSTSFALTIGRRDVTSNAWFSAWRIAAESAPAAHAAPISDTTVTVGPRSATSRSDSATSEPSTGKKSIIASSTRAWSVASRSTMPKIDISSRVAGNRANSVKYEIEPASCVPRSAAKFDAARPSTWNGNFHVIDGRG